MEKNLTKYELIEDCAILYGHFYPYALYGDQTFLKGDCSGLRGNLSGLRGILSSGLSGNCTGVIGNCTGLIGSLDKCKITDEEREKGIYISDLVK